MMRVLPCLLALGLILAAAPPAWANPAYRCVRLPSTALACGEVTVVCGAASAAASTTYRTSWTFVVQVDDVTITRENDLQMTTFGGGAQCSEGTCTRAALYGDGVLIVAVDWVCF